jgi:hypothetical protein
VFAVHEPRFDVSRSVDVDMIYLGGDITATVCRTARLRGSFAPVNVVKAWKDLQQLEAELLEFRFVEVREVQLIHDAECRSTRALAAVARLSSSRVHQLVAAPPTAMTWMRRWVSCGPCAGPHQKTPKEMTVPSWTGAT